MVGENEMKLEETTKRRDEVRGLSLKAMSVNCALDSGMRNCLRVLLAVC